MNTLPKYLCRMVSFLGLACALFCLWYVAVAASSIFSSPPPDTPPRFTEWYVTLSTIAAIIAIGVAVGSIGLMRLHIRGVRILTICSLLPLVLLVIVGMSWLSPMGMSIAAATGVSLGGLMPMMLSLLPVWAGLLWTFAFRPHQPLKPSNS
ncbi:MAG: hypothetical protein KF712_21075 [Akkermansiaceae bacterium]|nr:hypothetical protein [Akkermansiaceae bacterium]